MIKLDKEAVATTARRKGAGIAIAQACVFDFGAIDFYTTGQQFIAIVAQRVQHIAPVLLRKGDLYILNSLWIIEVGCILAVALYKREKANDTAQQEEITLHSLNFKLFAMQY